MLFITFSSIEDKKEFYRLYEKYNKLVYRCIYEILNNSHDTEDALQKTWFKVSENMDKIENSNEKMKVGYICTIAKNTAIDLIRKNKESVAEIEFVSEKCSYMDIYKFVELADFKEAIMSLENEYRYAIMLKYAYGYSIKEIAKEMNISETNVGTIIYRAKKHIKRYIESIGDKYE